MLAKFSGLTFLAPDPPDRSPDQSAGLLHRRGRCSLGQKVPDVGEQFELGWGSVRRHRWHALLLFDERALLDEVDRNDEREIDDDCDEQELDDRGDQRAEVDDCRSAAVQDRGNRDRQRLRERRGTEERTDRGIDYSRDDRVDDVGERRTDDDRDRKVDDVTAQDELFETLEHRRLLKLVRAHTARAGYPAALVGDAAGADEAGFEAGDPEPDDPEPDDPEPDEPEPEDFDSVGFDSEDFDSDGFDSDDVLSDDCDSERADAGSDDFWLARESLR
jgi:hypothetical protein